MTYKEYRDTLDYEIYNQKKPKSIVKRFRIKHFQPNTNAMYLCRKMWYLYGCGGIKRAISKFIYLKLYRKYGCCIYPNIDVGKGFFISHPVGIVIGKCKIGDNFHIYQNCSIGVRRYGEESKGLYPNIGNNVWLYSNSLIIGKVTVADNITIGAFSIVTNDLHESGTYVGVPATMVKKNNEK